MAFGGEQVAPSVGGTVADREVTVTGGFSAVGGQDETTPVSAGTNWSPNNTIPIR